MQPDTAGVMPLKILSPDQKRRQICQIL